VAVKVSTTPPPRRRWLTPWTVVWVVVWGFVLIRLGPHLAAVVGLDTGGDRTPAFRYPTLAGDTVSNVSLGGKVVLVNFWATWCPPCKVEMPLLQSMAERHAAAGLVVLGLSRDRAAPTEVAAFLAERGITYPVAIVGPDAERSFGGVQGYPTSFLLDRSGRIRHKALGPLAMVSFEPAVRRLLTESADDGPRHAGGRAP
jgi:thiol-disulfide isomerase/thioredoxin